MLGIGIGNVSGITTPTYEHDNTTAIVITSTLHTPRIHANK